MAYNPDQEWLLPPSVGDELGEGHLRYSSTNWSNGWTSNSSKTSTASKVVRVIRLGARGEVVAAYRAATPAKIWDSGYWRAISSPITGR